MGPAETAGRYSTRWREGLGIGQWKGFGGSSDEDRFKEGG